MNRRFTRYGDFKLSFIDFLYSVLFALIVLFLISIALIMPKKQENEGIRKNADFVITLEWPVDVDCDVDLWVRDPQNNLVSYRYMEGGLMYFERDDMGKRRSLYQIDGKELIIDPDNKEFVTLRGTFPGEYIVNAHVYSCVPAEGELGVPAGTLKEIPITVEIIRINPSFIVVKRIDMKMDSVWQEKTVIRFTMDKNKGVLRFKNDQISIRTTEKKSVP